MANVLHRTIGATAPYTKQYLVSVNTQDYNPSEWLINPDLSAVQGFSPVYWDVVGDSVVLVDQATRDARDAELAAITAAAELQREKDSYDQKAVLRALALVLLDEVNILRAQHSLPPRTAAQARNAIRAKLDENV